MPADVAQLNANLASFHSPLTDEQYQRLCDRYDQRTVDVLISYAVAHQFRHATARMLEDALTCFPPLNSSIDARLELEALTAIAHGN